MSGAAIAASGHDDRTSSTPRLVLLVVAVVLGLALAVSGSWAAAGAAQNEAHLGHSSNVVAWWALAVLPWIVVAGLLAWFGGRQGHWRRALALSAAAGIGLGFVCYAARVVYSLSGL